MGIEMTPIGTIRTPFQEKSSAPIQGVFRPDTEGTVELDEALADGLLDVDGFSHLHLLYLLDRSAPVELIRLPLLADDPHGIFATRFPARPNRIGMTVVRLLSRVGAELRVSGVDMLDETPLLDIKPYVPQFDAVPNAIPGWFAGRSDRPKPPGRE